MKRFILLACLLLVLLPFACAPRETPQPTRVAPTTQATAPASLPVVQGKEAWQREWEKIGNEAKQEGKVVIYSGLAGEVRRAIIDAFKQQYGIDVEWVGAREWGTRLVTERRAKLRLADVAIGGSSTSLTLLIPEGVLTLLEPVIILPEALDSKAWWGGSLRWIDPEHRFGAFASYTNSPLAINTGMVKPEEIESYRDLLKPKWKKKIVMDDPTMVGSGQKWFGAVGSSLMGWDFLRELAKQEPIVIQDRRLAIEWLAHGKYPIVIAPKPETVAEFLKAGAPVRHLTPAEGSYLTCGGGAVGVVDGAPHPNAAKLFINWLLTKDAQTTVSRAYGVPSGRQDVPTDHIEPSLLLKPGTKYFDSDSPDFVLKMAEHNKMAREILGHLMGR